jgi:hypothetical protein
MGEVITATKSGHYKLTAAGELLHAPNRVTAKGFVLDAKAPAAKKAVGGWQWFDSREAAVKALGYVEPVTDETTCLRTGCPDRITS